MSQHIAEFFFKSYLLKVATSRILLRLSLDYRIHLHPSPKKPRF